MDDYVGHLREFRRILRNLEGQATHPLNRETIDSLSRKLDRDESQLNSARLQSSIRATVDATATLEELARYEQDVTSVFFEVVDRKRKELERERFRRLLDQSAESILVIEPHTGRFLDVNERAVQLLGYSRAELLELSLNHIEVALPLTPSSSWNEWFSNVPSAPEAVYLEGIHRRKDGSRFPVEVSATFVPIDDVKLILLVARDATDRRRSEARLKRQWAFFSRLAHRSIDGVLAFDRNFHLTYWNPAVQRILGQPRESVIGKNVWEALPQLKELGEDRYFRDALAGTTSTSRNRPYTQVETGRQVFFDGYYSPLTEENGEIVGGIAILRDVTERREFQLRQARDTVARQDEQKQRDLEEKRRLQAEVVELAREVDRLKKEQLHAGRDRNEVESAERVEELQLLAKGVAREVEPLMAGILSQTGLALAELPSGSSLRRGVEEIEEAALSASELAAMLSSFSGNGSAEGGRVQLDQLLVEIEHSLRALLLDGPAGSLELELGSEEVPLWGDSRQIRELVMVLVQNAADAMVQGGGPIRVRTGASELDANALKEFFFASGANPGTFVFLEVSDMGEGMDQQTLSRIFIPFFSTRPGHRGLGLATALAVVRAHGGALSVESARGQGTTFRVYFPIH
ncbi:MAG TPA: PAS domain S-box protein [Vicinamibacteria bacterium]|nr:PAS domain S-box protein [Vicinamibacteria bacterium]